VGSILCRRRTRHRAPCANSGSAAAPMAQPAHARIGLTAVRLPAAARRQLVSRCLVPAATPAAPQRQQQRVQQTRQCLAAALEIATTSPWHQRQSILRSSCVSQRLWLMLAGHTGRMAAAHPAVLPPVNSRGHQHAAAPASGVAAALARQPSATSATSPPPGRPGTSATSPETVIHGSVLLCWRLIHCDPEI
jgi:hypothetical protein